MMTNKILNILKEMHEEEKSKNFMTAGEGKYTHADRQEALNFAIFLVETQKKKDEIEVEKDVSFNNLKIESNGEITKVFIDDIEQHYVTKIELEQTIGENLKFHIAKDIRH